MNHKLGYNRISKLVKACIAFCIVTIFSSVVIFFFNETQDISFLYKINYDKFSAFATFVSSICGVGIGLLTLYLVFETFKSQQKELQETSAALAATERTNKIQQFESAFFQMLNNHSRIISSYDYIKTGEKNEYISDWNANSKTGVDLLNYLFQRCYEKTFDRHQALLFKQFKTWDEIMYIPLMDEVRRIHIVKYVVKDILTIFQFIQQHKENDLKQLAQREEPAKEPINWKIYEEILLNTLYDSEKYFFASYNFLTNSKVLDQLGIFIEHFKTFFISPDIENLKEPQLFRLTFEHGKSIDQTEFSIQLAFIEDEKESFLRLRFDNVNGIYVVPENAKFIYDAATVKEKLDITIETTGGVKHYIIDISSNFKAIYNLGLKQYGNNISQIATFFNQPPMNTFRIEFGVPHNNFRYSYSIPFLFSFPAESYNTVNIWINKN